MSNRSIAHKTLEDESMRISYREGIIEDEQIFENHCHTRYEMIAVFEGRVSIVVDNRKYSLKSGEIAMIPPLAYHSVYGGEVMYKRATILFDGSILPPQITADFKEKTRLQPVSVHDTLPHVLSGIKDIFATDGEEKFLPLARSLLTEAIYIHTYKDTSGKRERSHPTVKSVTEYIDKNITERLTLDEIAESVFLSKSTVSHIFRSEMKISVKQYILQKKLGLAAKLLEEGRPAGEVAALVGYDNYANFYKMYKKIFGVSPKASLSCK